MFTAYCLIQAGGEQDARPAIVSVVNVVYCDTLPAMQLVCDDGSILLKRMSPDFYRTQLTQWWMRLGNSKGAVLDLQSCGEFIRLAPADQYATLSRRSPDFAQDLDRTIHAWDSVKPTSVRGSSKPVNTMNLGD